MPPENDTPKAPAPSDTGKPVPSVPEIFTFKDVKLFDGTLNGSITQPQPSQYQGQASYLFGNNASVGASLLLGTQPLSIDRYGLNGQFGLGNGGLGKLNFEALPPLGTYTFNTDFKFGNGNTLLADLTKSPAGVNLGANGTFGLDNGGKGTGAVRYDGANQTFNANTGLTFGNGNTFNADLTRNPLGLNLGANGTFGLDNAGKGTGAVRYDGPNQTFSANTGLTFGNGNTFSADVTRSPSGSIYGADGSFGIGNGTAMAGFRINELERTGAYNLGAQFGKDQYNLKYATSPEGNTLGAGAQFGFGNDKGTANLNATFGPKLSELTGGVAFKDKDLEYSANLKLNNQTGNFGLAEIGGKLSKGNDREKFSIEGNYKPQNNEYSVKLSYTLSFGGSDRRMSPPTPQESSRQLDGEVASFRDKQAIAMLNPQDKKLYDQAAAGVEKLNAGGANLPVQETAASLAALANQRGLTKIDEVSLGNPTADGKRNLFVFEGNPNTQGAKPPVFIDSAQAAATPVQSSTQILQRTPNAPETQTAALTQDSPQLAMPKQASR